jgi:hypothetical protein
MRWSAMIAFAFLFFVACADRARLASEGDAPNLRTARFELKEVP